jgi:hypothetical protein
MSEPSIGHRDHSSGTDGDGGIKCNDASREKAIKLMSLGRKLKDEGQTEEGERKIMEE